jgi:hypothetical protein
MGKYMGEARPNLPTDEQLQPLIDEFVWGGYTDCVKRSDNRVEVLLEEGFHPVVDLQKECSFPGARSLYHIARYFYALGKQAGPENTLPINVHSITLTKAEGQR